MTGAEILGSSGTLFNCGGGPFGGDELACVGAGKQAEVGRLTADVHQEVARFRLLGKLPGKPFTEVFAGPDGKHLLARRIDGFYALPVGFPVTVLSWSGNH